MSRIQNNNGDNSHTHLTRPRPPAVPSSDLWDLVVDMDWPRVIEHVQEFPHDAEYVDGHYDESVLYLCCQNNPPLSAVQAIRRAYPQAVAMKNSRDHRELPLHVACRYQMSLEILAELVQNDPTTTVVHSRIGRTPIMELWEARRRKQEWWEQQNQQQQQQYRQRQEEEEEEDEDNHDEGNDDARTSVFVALQDDGVFWEKMLVLLRAVARHRQNRSLISSNTSPLFPVLARPTVPRLRDGSNAPTNGDRNDEHLVVHAAVWLSSYGCPIQVLHYVIQRFPIQVRTRDSGGKLPLQIAVGPTPFQLSMRRQYLPREQEIVAVLINAYPKAAQLRLGSGCPTNTSIMKVEDSRFPLMAALHHRHNWTGGVEDLVGAAPGILLIRDPVTKLYPFQLAAAASSDTATVDLDTIYELLRAQPQVMNLLDFSTRKESRRLIWTENILSATVIVALVGIVAQMFLVTITR
jgi:hypothetical protein